MTTRSLLLFCALALLSACATPRQPPPRSVVHPVPVRPAVPACRDCGRLERVEMVSNVRATPGGGAVLGGVVGGVVSKPASAAPAKRGVQVLTFKRGVRMDDGRRLILHQSELASGLRTGSRVRVSGGRVLPLR